MIRLLSAIVVFVSFQVQASVFELFQYPENRTYTSADRGMMPYRALSLYNTNTFTLTFDDGPHPTQTAQLLDVLKKHDVKVSFFVLTPQINDSNFAVIKRMLDEGHIVGSHGFDHINSNERTEAEWKAKVKQSLLDLARWHEKAGHEFTRIYYRYPYGAYGTRTDYHHMNSLQALSKELMGDNCIQFAFWDVDTVDWLKGMTAKEVAQNIIAQNEGGRAIDFKTIIHPNGRKEHVKKPITVTNPTRGGVVLQHDIQPNSVQATDLFLTYAKNRGVKILPLDEVEEFRVTKDCRLK